VFLRRNISVLLCAFLYMLLITGCTGTRTFLRKGGEDEGGLAAAPREKGRHELEEWDVDSLLTPVVRLSLFHVNVDLYEQFFWNDRTPFPTFLYYIFHETPDGYAEGTGSIVAEKAADGSIEYVLERALLKTNSDGSMWWQVHQTTLHRTVLYEVLVSEEGVPLRIRSTHPDTGERVEAVFEIGTELVSARENKRESQFFERLEQGRKAEITQERNFLFRKPEILGRERVVVEGGTYSCAHLRDVLPEDDLVIDYWIGQNAPGHVVKILYRTGDGLSRGEVELVHVGSRYELKFGAL